MTETLAADPAPTQTSAWRLYGIVPAGTSLPALPESEGDLGNRQLQLLTSGRIAAVVEPIDPEQRAGRQDLLAHSELLNALADSTPVVPVAFGSAFDERDQVTEEMLAPNHDHLVALLDRLRGHAQFVLRLRYFMDELLADIVAGDQTIASLRDRTRDAADGDRYGDKIELGAQVNRAVDDRLAADADWLSSEFSGLSAETMITNTAPATGSVTVAFLVPNAERTAFESRAEGCAEQLHEFATLTLHGPLAAFDFVREQ